MSRSTLRRYLTPCITALLLTLVLAPAVDLYIRRVQQENAMNTIRVATSAVSEAIDRWYDERVKDLELLAKQGSLLSDDLTIIQSVLTDFQRKDRAIQVCVLFDDDGQVLTSSAVPPGTTNYAKWPWFEAAVQGQTAVSYVHTSPITGRNIIAILSPVRTSDGSVVRVVGTIIELMSLQYAVEDSALAGAGQAYLVDPDGQIVQLGHYGGKPTTLMGHVETPATIDLKAGKSGSGTYTGVSNADVCGCYSGLHMPGWGVIVEQDADASIHGMTPLRVAAAGASVTFSALVALSGWFLWAGRRRPAEYAEASGGAGLAAATEPAEAPEPVVTEPAAPDPTAPGPIPSETAPLSAREREILNYVASGMTNKEIATVLFLSEHTVKAHLHRILGKLNLENRTQAAAYALRHLHPGAGQSNGTES